MINKILKYIRKKIIDRELSSLRFEENEKSKYFKNSMIQLIGDAIDNVDRDRIGLFNIGFNPDGDFIIWVENKGKIE